MKMIKDTTFATSDLALATLLSLTFPIKFIDKTISNRVEFIFDNSSELNKLVEAFWKQQLQIEPNQFYQQLRLLKARIYDKR